MKDKPQNVVQRRIRSAILWIVALIVLALVALSYNQIDLIVNWVIKFC